MAGSATGPERGGLTAGHGNRSAPPADRMIAIEVARTGGISVRAGLRVAFRSALSFLALATLTAVFPADATSQHPADLPAVSTGGLSEAPAFTVTDAGRGPASPSPDGIPGNGHAAGRNPPATGHLRISAWGTASWMDSLRVGGSLTVNTDSIKDADGLEHVEWEYQWIRVTTGGSETSIAEATRSWYYVSESDIGHRLKVRVSFLDDEANRERVESELSAVVDVMTTEEHALISLEADKDTVEVGQRVNFTIRRRGEMQQQIRGDINVQGLRSDIHDWYLYAYVFRGQATRNWNLQVEEEPGGVHTPGRTITALLRGVFDDFALVDTTAVTVVVVPAGTLNRGDVGPPDAQSATVDASTLVIWYNETLGSGSNPPASAYSVRINGGTGTNPTAVEVAGRTVTLTLGTPAAYGDDVTVSYAAPNTGAVQDEAQNEAGNLTNYPVTNNTAAPTPTISAPVTLRLNEDVGTHSFTVSLSESLNQNVTVSVAVQAGTATASSDFQVSPGSLTIPAGQTSSRPHTITIVDDDIDEGNETFSLALSSPSSGATLGNSTTTVTIVDDDTRGLFPSPRTVTVPEDGMDEYTLVLESKPTSTVTVTASRTGDSDITVTRGASLQFTTDNWYVPQTVELSAAADADSADGTATITHTTSGGDYGSNNVSATVTATESDTSDDGGDNGNNGNNGNNGHSVSTGVTLLLNPSGVGESEGLRTVTVTGRLNGEAMEAAKTVTVSVGAGGDGAISGTDYTTSGGFSFEIPGGQTQGSGTFTITPTDDDLAEGNESITVSGAVSGLDITPATLTIVDDDIRGLFPSPREVTVPEGGTETYTLVLESKPTATVTVTARRTGDSDITVTEGASLTFTADDWFRPQTVTLSAAADSDNTDGTATITHTAAGGDYGADHVTATVTATEDDDGSSGGGSGGGGSGGGGGGGGQTSSAVSLSVNPYRMEEGDGPTQVTVTGTLDDGPQGSPTTVTVTVGASGDGATPGADYEVVNDFALEIPAGQPSGSATFTFTPVDDGIIERSETVRVSGTATGVRVNFATLVIVDNDRRGLFPSPRTVTVPEGETATYTLVLESKPTAVVSVTAVRTGDQDITVTGGETLTFTPDDWYVPRTVTLSAAHDDDEEDGTATITHTASGGDYDGVTAAVRATEKDRMRASTIVTLSLSPSEVGEADGQKTVTVTGALDRGALEAATTVSVVVGAVGDVAEEGIDYGSVADFAFEIAAGMTSGSGTFSITPTDDDYAEGDESVTVSGSTAGLTVDDATLTIVDNDRRGLFPSPRTVTVPEGETATYTLVLESKPTAAVSVTAVRTGDQDITVTGGETLTFTPDDWYVPQTVTLSAAHDDDEEDGTATITHTASGGGYDGVTAAVTAIEEDDEGAWTLEFRSNGSTVTSVAEGAGSVEIVATRGQAPSEPMVVALSGEGSAASGSDWQLETTTITLAAGATETTAALTILEDARLEDSESVTVRARVDGSEVASGALEILDDDRAQIALVTETPTVEEGSSVTVSVLVKPADAGCVIPFDIMPSLLVEDDGAAVSSTVPSVVMIPACESTATFSFDTDDDDEATGDRLVVFTAEVSEDDRISSGTLTVRVTDNDNSPAEGAPTITGTPQVDETLTAHTDGISDPDGLTEVAWRYQWLLVSGGSEAEIADATERTYVVRPADVGGRLKVRVDFEDDAGNAESLTSAPTEEVRPAPVTPVVTISELTPTITEGEQARFVVRAEPSPESALTVIVHVAGTNDILAGTPSPSVTFEAGQDSAILTVETRDDDVDEGVVAGAVTAEVLAGPGYEVGTPATAIVTVQDDDEDVSLDLTGWLARVGRTASDQVVETVRERMTRGPGGNSMVIGGWDVVGLSDHWSAKPSDRLAMWSANDPSNRNREDLGKSARELFGRSSFSASGQLGGGGYWSAWGRGARTAFRGGEGDAAVDGEMNGFMAGFDFARGRWVGGVVMSHNRADGVLGSGSREHDVGTILTGAYPWARYSVSDHFSVWGMLGYAGGSLSLDGGSESGPNANLAMAAFGWRGDVVGTSGEDGFSLAVTSDAMVSRASTGGDALIGEQDGTATRARFLVEGSHKFRVGDATLQPLAEMGLRRDDGDAETGAGMEMGGGLSVTIPSLGLTLQGRARGLLAHADDTYEEWGGSAVLRVQPDPSGRGLSLRMAPRWGHADGSAARLFGRRDMSNIAAGRAMGLDDYGGMDAEFGYGVPVGALIAMPYGGLMGDARRVGLALRSESLFDLRFEGMDGYGHRALRLAAGLEAGSLRLTLEGMHGPRSAEARLSLWSRFWED